MCSFLNEETWTNSVYLLVALFQLTKLTIFCFVPPGRVIDGISNEDHVYTLQE